METTAAGLLTFRMRYELGLLVVRLLVRDGFVIEGPMRLTANRLSEVRIVVETEGRCARVVEIMNRWAPEAIRLHDAPIQPAA